MLTLFTLLFLQLTLFQEGTISTNAVETAIAFDQDESIIYLARFDGAWGKDTNPPSKIVRYEKTEKGYSFKGFSAFSSEKTGDSDSNIFISYDGRFAFFLSDRPYEGKIGKRSAIWRAERIDGEWKNLKALASEINDGNYISSPVTDANGNLFFTSMRDGGIGMGDMYVANYMAKSDSYAKPELLNGEANSSSGEWNLIVSPKADWIIFESSGRADGLSPYGDLYLSKQINGVWQKAVHLKDISSTGSDLRPRISLKQNSLFISSSKTFESTDCDIFYVPLSHLGLTIE